MSFDPPLELDEAVDVERAEEGPLVQPRYRLHVVRSSGMLEIPEVDGKNGGIELERTALVHDGAFAEVASNAVENLAEAVGGAVGVAVGPEEREDAGAVRPIWSTGRGEREEGECSPAPIASVRSLGDGERAERGEMEGSARRMRHGVHVVVRNNETLTTG